MIKQISTLAASVALSFAAYASPQTTSETLNFLPVAEVGDNNQDGTFSLFETDGGLREMTSAHIRVTGVISPTVKLKNVLNDGGTDVAALESGFFAELRFSFPLLGIENIFSHLVTSTNANFECSAGEGITCDGVADSLPINSFFDVSYDIAVNSGDFALLKASVAGDLGYSCLLDVQDTDSKNPATEASTTTGGSCTTTIDYFYDTQPGEPSDVPEPGTMALVGLALAGMGWTARRRQSRAQS